MHERARYSELTLLAFGEGAAGGGFDFGKKRFDTERCHPHAVIAGSDQPLAVPGGAELVGAEFEAGKNNG